MEGDTVSRRNWIKIYPEGFLRRTLFIELSPVERWVWIGFLCLAGDNAFDGKICIAQDMGYTDEQLAKLLDTDLKTLVGAKKKMVKFNKISVDKNNVIEVVSWNTYQSEYQRQRDYRQEKLQRKVTTQSYNAKLRLDRDRDIDIDKEEDKIKKNINSSDLKLKSEPKVKINYNHKTGKWENITDDDLQLWRLAYPACDIPTELAKAKVWIIENPEKGHKSRWGKFITNWLSRSQDRGGTKNV